MHHNILKPFGEKDIVSSNHPKKKKRFLFLKIYFCVIFFLLSFFTIYAYRMDLMDVFHVKNRDTYPLNVAQKQKVIDELHDHASNKEDKDEIKAYLNQLIPNTNYLIVYEKESDSQQNEVLQDVFINQQNTYYLDDVSLFEAQEIAFTFQDGVEGILYIYPNYHEYFSWYRIIDAILSIIIVGITYIGISRLLHGTFLSAWKKRLERKIYFRWTHHLSVKLLLVNTVCILFASGLFLFMYWNRYCFFEFMCDLNYAPKDTSKVFQIIQTELAQENITFKVKADSKAERESLKEKQRLAASKIIERNTPDDMEIYLYDTNAMYFAGSKSGGVNDYFVRDSIYGVNAVSQSLLRADEIELKDGTGELWIFYYPLFHLVLPYIVVISVIAISIYLIFMSLFIQRKVKEIHLIYEDIGVLANGDWEHEVFAQGTDEIARLGEHLNQMRISFLESSQREAEAKRANRDLINTISHDLRTPLTSLMGYLEILEHGKYQAEELKTYLHKCMEKSEQLKDRADRLFNYFMVFAEEEMEMKEMTVFTFLGMVNAMKEELEMHGYHVQVNELNQDALLMIDQRQMERVFDNIRSNLLKYAALDTVKITIEVNNRFMISFLNHYQKHGEVESNHIGLKSIAKILQGHHGYMEVREEEHEFELRIYLPIIQVYPSN